MLSKSFFTCLLLLLAASLSGFAQTTYRLSRGTMAIHGTSTLHGWHANCKNVNCAIGINAPSATAINVTTLLLQQDVKSIKSSEGNLMDKYMHEAMKAEQYPSLKFQMTQGNISATLSDGCELTINGNLTIAGVTKAIDLKVTAHKLSTGEFRFEGTEKLNMSWYGIKPPVVMGMKVGDEVSIKWDLYFTPNN